MENTPSATVVLNVPELLENIILHLSPRDILLAQRVCQYWKETVENSILAQQATFQRPVEGGFAVWTPSDEESPYSVTKGRWLRENGIGVRPVLNTIMRRFIFGATSWNYTIPYHRFVCPISESNACPQGPGPLSLGHRTLGDAEELHPNEVPWRTMFVMQPPCTKMTVVCNFYGSGWDKTFNIESASGVTLQDLRIGLREHLKKCPSCPADNNAARWDVAGFMRRDVCVPAVDGWCLLKSLESEGGPQEEQINEHYEADEDFEGE